MWCVISTRTNLGFAAGYLSLLNSNSTQECCKTAKKVLAYLKGSFSRGIGFGIKQQCKLARYSNSDYARDLDSRRSTTGFALSTSD